MSAQDLINWGELSRFLSGSRQTVSDHQLSQQRECGVSLGKMDEIVSLLEEAYVANDVDKNQLLAIAVNRVDSLNSPY